MMKWYDKIGIAIWGLSASVLFLLLSYWIRAWDWWPEFLLILAESALSVVIVLKIVEVSTRIERERRWAPVKLAVYSLILDKLGLIGYHVCRTILMVLLEPLEIDRERIERQGMDSEEAIFVLQSLADSIRRYYKFLYDINKYKTNSDPMKNVVEDLIDCFNNIDHEINEYKNALVPRVLALSDDVEVNHALLRFEEVYSIIFYRKDFLKRYNPSEDGDYWDKDKKYLILGENFVDPAFLSLANLLDSAAYLYWLLQLKSEPVPERGPIEVNFQELKRWFLRYWKNDNVVAFAFQIAVFLILFVLSSYAIAAIFMH